MATIPLDKANDIAETPTSFNQLSGINYWKIFLYSNENVDLETLPLICFEHTLTFEIKMYGPVVLESILL